MFATPKNLSSKRPRKFEEVDERENEQSKNKLVFPESSTLIDSNLTSKAGSVISFDNYHHASKFIKLSPSIFWNLKRAHIECERLKDENELLRTRFENTAAEGERRIAKLESDRKFLVEEVNSHLKCIDEYKQDYQDYKSEISRLGHVISNLETSVCEATVKFNEQQRSIFEKDFKAEQIESKLKAQIEKITVDLNSSEESRRLLERKNHELMQDFERSQRIVKTEVTTNLKKKAEDSENVIKKVSVENKRLKYENETLKDAQRTIIFSMTEELLEMRSKMKNYTEIESALFECEQENKTLKLNLESPDRDCSQKLGDIIAKNAELVKAHEEIAKLRKILSSADI